MEAGHEPAVHEAHPRTAAFDWLLHPAASNSFSTSAQSIDADTGSANTAASVFRCLLFMLAC